METGPLLIALFVAVEGAHAFSAFMPSYFTVAKFADGPEDRARLRSGYAPAVLFNLILGGATSGLIKDTRPILCAVLVSVFMVAMYERAIGGMTNANADRSRR